MQNEKYSGAVTRTKKIYREVKNLALTRNIKKRSAFNFFYAHCTTPYLPPSHVAPVEKKYKEIFHHNIYKQNKIKTLFEIKIKI